MSTILLGIVALVVLYFLVRVVLPFIGKLLLYIIGTIIGIPIFLLCTLLYPIYKHFYLAIILAPGVRGIFQQDWLMFGISLFIYMILSYWLLTKDSKKAFTQEIKTYLQKNGAVSLEELKKLNSKDFSINSDKSSAFFLSSKKMSL